LESAAPEDVQVKMVDGLATITAAVHDETIATRGKALVASDGCRPDHEATGKVGVFGGQCVKRGDVPTRDDQDMNRCLGVDVPEGEKILVGKNLGAGNVAGGYAAEETG